MIIHYTSVQWKNNAQENKETPPTTTTATTLTQLYLMQIASDFSFFLFPALLRHDAFLLALPYSLWPPKHKKMLGKPTAAAEDHEK